ncbi:MAG: RT0821/Lpp0805 family surface protein [Geminicoccaceae bacterium]
MSRAVMVLAGVAALATGCASPSALSPPAAAETDAAPATVLQYVLETTPSGEAVAWRVEATGAVGTVTPLRTYRTPAGYCRAFLVTIAAPAAGTRQGTACRTAAGEWRESVDA